MQSLKSKTMSIRQVLCKVEGHGQKSRNIVLFKIKALDDISYKNHLTQFQNKPLIEQWFPS